MVTFTDFSSLVPLAPNIQHVVIPNLLTGATISANRVRLKYKHFTTLSKRLTLGFVSYNKDPDMSRVREVYMT